MAVDDTKLNDFLGQFVQDLGATVQAGMVVLGHRLGLYRAMAGAGRLRPAELAERTGTAERYVAEWLAAQAAAGYVAYDPASGRFSLPEEQAFALADPAGLAYLPGAFSSPGPASRPSRASPRRSAPVPGSAGTSRTRRSSTAARCSSLPATGPTWSSPGSRPWTGSRPSCGRGRGSPTSAAATAPRPSSWPGSTPTRPSPGSTTTSGRSTGPVRPPRTPASPTGSGSRPPRLTASAGTATTWWRPSTASTTWATRPGRPPISAAPWPTTAPGCWSSRPPASAWRTTSTRWGGCTTPSRCCCACPTPCPSSPRPCSATRPARPGPASWPPPAASPGSAGPPRPRSTLSTRCAHDPARVPAHRPRRPDRARPVGQRPLVRGAPGGQAGAGRGHRPQPPPHRLPARRQHPARPAPALRTPAPEGDFSEFRAGLDHVAFGVADRAELEKWARRLDKLGIAHGRIKDAGYGSGLSFRDPDGIALEFFAPPS